MNTITPETRTLRILPVISLITIVLYGVFFNTTTGHADTAIASYVFSISDGASTAKDLNDTYKTKADSGYKASSGIYASSSLLYASVNNPSAKDYRKLEWSKDSEYKYNNASQPATPLIEASEKNPWGTTPFFLIKTSSKSYGELSISFRIGASKKGPRDYKVQYSTNGDSYTDISGSSFSLASNKTLYQKSFKLPDSASNQSTLYVRIITTSTTTVENGSTSDNAKSGEIAINNITITGTSYKTAATAAPKASATPKPDTASVSKNNTGSSNTASTNNDGSTVSNSSGEPSTTASSSGKIKTLKLTSYKKGSKKIKGKSIRKAKICITIGRKKYSATASKKGKFTIKLDSKLKKGTIIKVYAEKKGYKKSKTKTYTVR